MVLEPIEKTYRFHGHFVRFGEGRIAWSTSDGEWAPVRQDNDSGYQEGDLFTLPRLVVEDGNDLLVVTGHKAYRMMYLGVPFVFGFMAL